MKHSIIGKILSIICQGLLATDLNTPYPFHALNIERLVSEIDLTLWAFIKSITRPISETHGYSTKANQPQTLQHHVKQVHCLFCLSALMFCTDDRCSFPFHTLITDVIESGGGSTQLIRILNRMGICSSADTVARSIQYSPEEDCMHNIPTIISMDNIDFQHSYARVFCGKQVSSCRRTTVQAVQPILHTPQQHSPMHEDIPGPENVEALRCSYSPSSHGECTAIGVSDMQESNRHMECALPENIPMLSKRNRSITIRSPHKPTILVIPKTKRRARTGAEGISNIPPPSAVDFPVPQFRHNREYTDIMNIEKFHLNSSEQCAIDNLQKEMVHTFFKNTPIFLVELCHGTALY